MVDRAKQGYVNVRRREVEIEVNDKLEEQSKKEMIEFMKDEKKWANEGLIHEVKEFNDLCKFADDNFDQFLFNKEDFHLQMEMKCKRGFLEIIEEAKRLNENIFEGMKEITNRISLDLAELTKIDEKNHAERNVVSTEDGTNEASDKENNMEEQVDTEKEETSLSKETPAEEGEGENLDKIETPIRRANKCPRLSTEKIIEFIEQALENEKNGIEDDDADTNQISSLTSQFKYINKNMKQGITNKLSTIFSSKGESASDLRHFLIKVLQGAPVLDHQIEKV